MVSVLHKQVELVAFHYKMPNVFVGDFHILKSIYAWQDTAFQHWGWSIYTYYIKHDSSDLKLKDDVIVTEMFVLASLVLWLLKIVVWFLFIVIFFYYLLLSLNLVQLSFLSFNYYC
jgi:hypothetical protein